MGYPVRLRASGLWAVKRGGKRHGLRVSNLSIFLEFLCFLEPSQGQGFKAAKGLPSKGFMGYPAEGVYGSGGEVYGLLWVVGGAVNLIYRGRGVGGGGASRGRVCTPTHPACRPPPRCSAQPAIPPPPPCY